MDFFPCHNGINRMQALCFFKTLPKIIWHPIWSNKMVNWTLRIAQPDNLVSYEYSHLIMNFLINPAPLPHPRTHVKSRCLLSKYVNTLIQPPSPTQPQTHVSSQCLLFKYLNTNHLSYWISSPCYCTKYLSKDIILLSVWNKCIW